MSSRYPFLDNWLDESDNVTSYENYLDSFLEQFDPNQRAVIEKMLNNYVFINRIRKEQIYGNYVTELLRFIASLNITGTYFIATPIKDNKPHNSDVFSICFKDNDEHFERNLSDNMLRDCDYLFLVDDYSGTGDTFVKYVKLKREKNVLKETAIVYAIPIFLTRIAKEYIEENNILTNIEISILRDAKYYSEKAIITPQEKAVFDEASFKRARIRRKYLNGYKETEDLFSLPYATPNNTFGLFWSDENTLYSPLFSRKNDQVYSMKQRRFQHELLRAANDMFIEENINEIEEKTRFSLYIPILMKAGYAEEEIKLILRLDDSIYDSHIIFLKSIDVITEEGTISDDYFEHYVDIDKFNIFLGMGIKPIRDSVATVMKNFNSKIRFTF